MLLQFMWFSVLTSQSIGFARCVAMPKNCCEPSTMLQANLWECYAQVDNDLWVVVPSMPKNAPDLVVIREGAYLN